MKNSQPPALDEKTLRVAAEGLLDGIKDAYLHGTSLDPDFMKGPHYQHLTDVMWMTLSALSRVVTGMAFSYDELVEMDPVLRGVTPHNISLTPREMPAISAGHWSWAVWRCYQRKILVAPANGDHARALERLIQNAMHECDEILQTYVVIDLVLEMEREHDVVFTDTAVRQALRAAEIRWVEAMVQNEVETLTQDKSIDQAQFEINVAKWEALHPDARRRAELTREFEKQ